jgi:hypothetical protein
MDDRKGGLSEAIDVWSRGLLEGEEGWANDGSGQSAAQTDKLMSFPRLQNLRKWIGRNSLLFFALSNIGSWELLRG